MEIVKAANLAVRFLLELAALAAFGYWGYRTGDTTATRYGLAIGLPVAAAIFWGAFVAPNAPVTLPGAVTTLLGLVVLGIAALALAQTGYRTLAIAFAVIAVVNAVLMVVWDQ
jgi:hypothetical protein